MSLSRRTVFLAAAALLLVACSPVPNALAITLGQVDDFEDGTTQNWGGLPVSNDPTAGPAGPTDKALFAFTAGGGGFGGKLIIHNGITANQWAGDWTAAGVTSLSMDLRNSGNSDLSIRLAIAGPGGFFNFGGGDTYATDSLLIPADNQWHNVAYDVTASGFTAPAGGGTDIAAALQDVTHFRILHNPSLSFLGDEDDAGEFFIDNITAVGVPEPASLTLLALLFGFASVVFFRR